MNQEGTTPAPGAPDPTRTAPGGSVGHGGPAHPDIGKRIGSYTILGLLGEGGMGVVYLAEQDKPRRQVALKVIRPGLASEQRLRRFEHEAQVLGRLQHPAIAQIYEAGTADTGSGPQPYFAMELVQGMSVTEYAESKRLGTRARLELFATVCDGVQHAHQKGVIHRASSRATSWSRKVASRRSSTSASPGSSTATSRPPPCRPTSVSSSGPSLT
jgi:serine/threonine protein kinase